MWGATANAIASIGKKKNSLKPIQVCSEYSDDEFCLSPSREERLECPICWESFNIVENVPYVLWCGHTLCKNCLLGLQWTVLKFPSQQIPIPFWISCPWCHLLSPRVVHKGNLKFPRKNFFVLWMIESLNGDRIKSPKCFLRDRQHSWSPRCSQLLRNQASNSNLKRVSYNQGHLDSDRNEGNETTNYFKMLKMVFHKSLAFSINFTAKFPLVIIFLIIIFYALPASAAILILYLLVTVLLALPSFLILYFAYPALGWLVKEITG
ncbi:Zinc finger, RING-type, eukaryotic [Dillenia turbinata]|uniref:Zinc finger, RING-type, eukaryotic n=1 Tax=Dillenia turbinata TaxID=194707 RepID=A0AAN8V5R9_9MAGN